MQRLLSAASTLAGLAVSIVGVTALEPATSAP
jgi:hypothetical protein